MSIALAGGVSQLHLSSTNLVLPLNLCKFHFSRASSLATHPFQSAADLFLNLGPNSNEACLLDFFWKPAANEAFLNHLPGLALVSEWHSQTLFPSAEDRRVDYSVLSKLQNGLPAVPILLIEGGTALIQKNKEHKDWTKLACLVSGCCLKRVSQLIALNKNPLEARCFGLLVGGTRAQCLVAHPVWTGADWFIQVSSDPHWFIDLQSPIQLVDKNATTIACIRSCCALLAARQFSDREFETIEVAESADWSQFVDTQSTFAREQESQPIFSQIFLLDEGEEANDPFDSVDISHLHYDDATSLLSDELEADYLLELDQLTNGHSDSVDPHQSDLNTNDYLQPESSVSSEEENVVLMIGAPVLNVKISNLQNSRLSLQDSSRTPLQTQIHEVPLATNEEDRFVTRPHAVALQRLNFFFQAAISRHYKLVALGPGSIRYPPFDDSFSSLICPQARETLNTAVSKQISSNMTIESMAGMGLRRSSSARLFQTTISIVKDSKFEMELYRKIATTCPNFFARTFSIQDDEETGKICYEFERLRPLMDDHNKAFYELNTPLCRLSVDECVGFNLLLALDTLVGLFVLHKRLGVLHCDISPNNILYSYFDKCWKLNDFDIAMPVEEAKNTLKISGTDGFIAPEVELCASLSEAADIYSLGKVYSMFIVPDMRGGLTRNRCQSRRHIQAYRNFSQCVHNMCSSKPTSRPSIEELIKTVLEDYKSLRIKALPNQTIRAAEEIGRGFNFDIKAPSVKPIPFSVKNVQIQNAAECDLAILHPTQQTNTTL